MSGVGQGTGGPSEPGLTITYQCCGLRCSVPYVSDDADSQRIGEIFDRQHERRHPECLPLDPALRVDGARRLRLLAQP